MRARTIILIGSLLFGLFLIDSFVRVKAAGPIKIKQKNPVVNEGNRIKLDAVDRDGKPVNDAVWISGSPDIAEANPKTGEVFGVKQGFATVTAQRGDEAFSVFVVVSRVRKGDGAKVPGDTKFDGKGRLYISNPNQNVILRAENALKSKLEVFAGKPKVAGRRNGEREEALFAGPTAIAVDSSANGGVYVADTLNHSIRKIGYDDNVDTLIGTGAPGLSAFDAENAAFFSAALLSSPRGIAADVGGNLYISDTDNHAIYYMDISKQKMHLLAGAPGESGKQDGDGRDARFHRPAGLALTSDGRLLAVADEDNNRVRLVEIKRGTKGEITGIVSTLGASSNAAALQATEFEQTDDQENGEIVFDKPQAVSIDGIGNIYIVDQSGVQIATRPLGGAFQVLQLAQPGVSFNQAVSIEVNGTESYVLDANAANESEALKIVTVGSPEIESVLPQTVSASGGAEVVVKGKNFAPESMVVFGGAIAKEVLIVSATEIRFRVEPQSLPGLRTVTILTRGGLAQRELGVTSKPASELSLGQITTVAGGKTFTGDGGRALDASIGAAYKTVADREGNLYIADFVQGVRRVDADTGIITTVAGGGNSLEDGVPATAASIDPVSIAIDGAGNLFIADRDNAVIRRADALTGLIATVAGKTGRAFGGDGGPAAEAGFGVSVGDIAFDRNGNLFVISEKRVRRIEAATGIITTIAGGGFDEGADGIPAREAVFKSPVAIAIDQAGNLLIADSLTNRLSRVEAASGIISTVIDGSKGQNKSLALTVFTIDGEGNIFFIDSKTQSILRRDAKSGNLSTALPGGAFNSPAFSKLFADGAGNLFITENHRIRRADLKSGTVTNVAGNGKVNFIGDGGPAVSAGIGYPSKAIADSEGNLFIADSENGAVRKIDALTGVITTLVGNKPRTDGNIGDGGPAAEAVCVPVSLAISIEGDLAIADIQTGRIRKVDAQTGIITTIAGNGKREVAGDGGPALKAGLGFPTDIAFDRKGNLLIADNRGIRRVSAKTGVISSIMKSTARLSFSIALDDRDNIYFVGGGDGVQRIDAKTGTIAKFVQFDDDASVGRIAAGSLAVSPLGDLFVCGIGFSRTDPRKLASRVVRINLKGKLLGITAGGNEDSHTGDGGLALNANIAGFDPSIAFDGKGNLLILETDRLKVCALRWVKLGER